MILSQADLAQYRACGFVVRRGLVEPGACDGLRSELSQWIARAAAERAAGRRIGFWEQMPLSKARTEVFFEEGDDWTERRVMRAGHALHAEPGAFRELALQSPVASAFAELLPAPVRIVSSAVVYKQPHSDAVQFGFHQDSAYLTYSPPSLALAFVALDRCDAASGALEVVPASHLRGVELRLRLGPTGFERVSGTEARYASKDAELLELEPGDVAFVEGCAYHASEPNRSAGPRRAVIVHAVGGDAAAEPSNWVE